MEVKTILNSTNRTLIVRTTASIIETTAYVVRTTTPTMAQTTVTKLEKMVTKEQVLLEHKVEVKPAQWSLYNGNTGHNKVVRPEVKYRRIYCCQNCKATNDTLQIRTEDNTMSITLAALVEHQQLLVYDVHIIIFFKQFAIETT
jgi:hypothetical protein